MLFAANISVRTLSDPQSPTGQMVLFGKTEEQVLRLSAHDFELLVNVSSLDASSRLPTETTIPVEDIFGLAIIPGDSDQSCVVFSHVVGQRAESPVTQRWSICALDHNVNELQEAMSFLKETFGEVDFEMGEQ